MTDQMTLSVAGAISRFSDAREAGAAYYRADSASMPLVMQGEPATLLARTRVEGEYSDGAPRYVKDLPRDEQPNAPAFKEGYLQQLRIDVDGQLRKADWKNAQPSSAMRVPRLAEPLYDKIAQLSRHNFKSALQTWMSRCKLAPSSYSLPTFLDPMWRYQMEGPQALKDFEEVAAKVLRAAAASQAVPAPLTNKLAGELKELSRNLVSVSRAPAARGRTR